MKFGPGVVPHKKKDRRMNLEMGRGLGFCRGAAGRVRTWSSAIADVRFGRWQRFHNSEFMCCGFILIFFAIVTTISYRYEPSILTSEGGEPFSRWNARDRADTSGAQNRRILSRGLQTKLELQQDIVEDRRHGIESKLIRRESRLEGTYDEAIPSGNPTTLGLVSEIRIFVYELPSEYNSDWLNNSRCSNHLFAAEVALHQILLESPLRTMDPEAADFFFVPVYVSCDFTPKNGFPSLTNASTMIRAAVDLISRQMIYWNRSGGSDHIFVASHDYGACFQSMELLAKARGIPEFLQKSIILQTFGQKEGHHPCQHTESIVIPPYVPLKSVQKAVEHQDRRILAYFRGKLELHPKNVSGQFYSKGVRTVIWQKFKKSRGFFLSRKRLEGYESEMLRSKFCLAPLGWAPWSPRIVESVLYGCVPVIIADNIALPHSHVIDWPSISLTVREKDVDKLDQILGEVVATNLTSIQRNLWKEENRRALIYTRSLVEGDASWQIFNVLAQKKVSRDAHIALMKEQESIVGEPQDNELHGDSFYFASL